MATGSQPSPSRAVLLMRIAVYGTVLLLAAATYAMRAGRAHSSEDRIDTLAGPAEGGGRVRLLARYGQVQFVEARVRVGCRDGRPGWTSTVKLSGGRGAQFRYRDRRRFVAWMHGAHAAGGEHWRYAIRARGELAADSRSASGDLLLTQVRLEDGRIADVCDARARFRSRSGMPEPAY